MKPDEAAKLLAAYVDGQLDAARSAELEAHLAENAASRAACERLRGLSAAIRDHATYHAAPAGLRARIAPAAPRRPTARRTVFWNFARLGASFAGVALLTWAVAIAVLRPGADDLIEREVLAGHVRATLGNRLIDVVSSDQHTVKPWLSARLNFSPPVNDFSGQGFELAGGRIDYAGGQPVAVLVYKRRQHVIDVFVWPAAADSGARRSEARGFNVEQFARGGMRYWLVSDLNSNELDDLAQLLASRAAAP